MTNAVNLASAAGTGFAFRNRIINGDMRIDQRNGGAVQNITTSNVYNVDRWVVNAGSATSGTLTAQRIATSSPGGPQYCLRLARTAGTFTGLIGCAQAIETANCYDLAGKTVTVSFKARAGSAYSATGTPLQAYVRTGTGADEGVNGATAGTWAGYAQAVSQSFTLTTSFQTFSFSVTLGSSIRELALLFYTGAFTGTGSANDYVDITEVQLEVGSVTTPFERRPYGLELALCQRYLEMVNSPGILSYNTTTNAYANWYYRVSKRVTPTISGFTAGIVTPGIECARADGATNAWAAFGYNGSTYVNCFASAEL